MASNDRCLPGAPGFDSSFFPLSSLFLKLCAKWAGPTTVAASARHPTVSLKARYSRRGERNRYKGKEKKKEKEKGNGPSPFHGGIRGRRLGLNVGFRPGSDTLKILKIFRITNIIGKIIS